MSDYFLNNGEFWTCPYNRGHQVRTFVKEHVEDHLEACRKIYLEARAAEGLDGNLKSCIFNPAHKFPRPEIELHELLCEDLLSCGSETESSEERVVEDKWRVNDWHGGWTANTCTPEQEADIIKWLENVYHETHGDDDDDDMQVSKIEEEDEGFGLEENIWEEIYKECGEEEKKEEGGEGLEGILGIDPFTGLALQE